MRIVADENIPLVDAFFGAFGKIIKRPGRSITPADVADADVLLVRSVTPVNEALLGGSHVGFVGTCTIGTDHIDRGYLEQAGIAWSSAPGCNARGVVDYVLGSILTLAERSGLDPSKQVYGIVGVGEVGGRLRRVLEGLGWAVKVCDPLKAKALGSAHLPLDALLEQCDVVSLHTPLKRGGDWPTHHLMDEARIQRMSPGSWLINASRGEVVDTRALRQRLQHHGDLRVVLDVWEHEPEVDVALAQLCELATPHIAGYSFDGRLRGTAQIYQALCRFIGTPETVSLESLLPEQWVSLTVSADTPVDRALRIVCRAVYDPREDDAAFRLSLAGDLAKRRNAFDHLRKAYAIRRELEGLRLTVTGDRSSKNAMELIRTLAALGVSQSS
jgi:erythronate-4-phosphate dehydrogenase